MKDKSKVRDGVIFEHQDSHAELSHFYEEDTNVLDGVSLKRGEHIVVCVIPPSLIENFIDGKIEKRLINITFY
jgi:hypothetical protein